MHSLHAPASSHKFTCQPVQKLRMGWRRSGMPKVSYRLHNTPAKIMSPYPIDHDPSCEWMIWLDEPARQSQTAAGRARPRPRRGYLVGMDTNGEGRRNSGVDKFSWVGRNTATLNVGWRRSSSVPESSNLRFRDDLGFKNCDVSFNFPRFLPVGRILGLEQ